MMKKKTIKILLIYMLCLLAFITNVNAADEAIIKMNTNSSALKKGEKLEITISITNKSIEDTINDIIGVLKFDKDIFKIEKIDKDDMTDEQKEIFEENEEEFGMLDVLSFQDNWIIVGIEEDDEYAITIMNLDEEDGIEEDDTAKVGKIKFTVLNTAKSGTTSVELEDIEINEEYEADDVATSKITISADETKEPQKTSQQQQQTGQSQQQQSTQANKDIVYTGAEDYIGLIVIMIIATAVLYKKCKDYKDI